MSDRAPEVAFAGVSLRYPNGVQALDNVTFSVPAGSICALMGGSGSGKTTLLKLVNRMERTSVGEVCLDGRPVESSDAVALRRSIGYVIQEGGLFPHWSAERNVGLVPRLLGCDQRTSDDLVTGAMEMARIPRAEFGHRRPDQLSGGQRQRVAIARAIAARPRLLLLDEPFGALDAKVRAELRQWLRRLHDEYPVTTLFVTHDQEEAFEVSDRVAVMNAGKVEQFDTPDAVFESPASAFVLDFLGNVNVFHGRVQDGKAHVGEIVFDCPGPENQTFGAAKVYVRPHDLDISVEPSEGASLQVRVTHLRPAGSVTRVVAVSIDGQKEIRVDLPIGRSRELAIRKGDVVFVHPRRAHVFAPDYAI